MVRPCGLLLAGALAANVHASVRGVNLGGWLVLEPWMTPSIFNATAAVDEWHLSNALGKDEALKTLQSHWSTFYTRDDFVAIKNAGLNAVRIPLGYWAVDLLDYEPYVSGQYPYLIQAVQWASQLDLTVLIDIHGAPGSQNGWEETGLVGPIAFPSNTSNTDRTLNVLRNLTQEFSKTIYNGAVTNIELMNEPIFALPLLKQFYTAGAAVVGAANSSGINVTIHDAFYNPPNWVNYDPYNDNADAPGKFLTLDTHQFWGFPPLDNLTEPEILDRVCTFGKMLRGNSTPGLLPTLVAEWSLDTGVTANSSSDTAQDQQKRTWFRTLFEAQNAAYSPNGPGQASIGWYFWAWKTEYDIDAWSYRKGVADGYIPSNVSNSSTYAFPLLDNGCIDSNFTYQAAATISTSSSSPTASPSTTLGDNSAPTKASSSTTSTSNAAFALPTMALDPLLVVAPVLLWGMA